MKLNSQNLAKYGKYFIEKIPISSIVAKAQGILLQIQSNQERKSLIIAPRGDFQTSKIPVQVRRRNQSLKRNPRSKLGRNKHKRQIHQQGKYSKASTWKKNEATKEGIQHAKVAPCHLPTNQIVPNQHATTFYFIVGLYLAKRTSVLK